MGYRRNRDRPARSANARWLSASGAVCLLVATGARELPAQERLQIVATLPAYGSIAAEIAGDRAEVTSIARGDEDAHFVRPRPSFAAALARADLFVSTGLDLELWVPALLDRANNGKVVTGAPGSVAAYSGVTLLEVPASVSRSEGDVHVFGNPHIYTDPINAILIARNILAGLVRIDPDNAELYTENTERFAERIIRSTFGDPLTDMLGADVLFALARKDEFWEFAAGQTFQDKPLTDYVGGWMELAAPFRGRRIACYHRNWAYFTNRFDVECAVYIEPKVGIPPSPGHVNDVTELMQREQIPALLAANYFSRSQVERVADRTDATAVVVPFNVGGVQGVDDYFELIDYWVTHLAVAFEGAPGDRSHP